MAPIRSPNHTVTLVEELTPAETRIVEAMSRGLTVPMAAEVLNYSPHTIHSYLATARMKLRAKNTAQAVGNALRLGLIR